MNHSNKISRNIFHRIALQGLMKSYTRTLVTIIGVVLSAAMITAVTTFGISLLDYLTKGAAEKYGRWHAAFLDVDASFVNSVQEQAGGKEVADAAAFENVGYALLEGCKNPDKPYLFIEGFQDAAFDLLCIQLLSGRMPENSSEVLISASIAANGGVSIPIGDTITLTLGDRMGNGRKLCQHDPYSYQDETFTPVKERTYTVVGVCKRPGFEEISAPGYSVITRADADAPAERYSLFVALEHPGKVRDYAQSRVQHAYILNDNVLRFMGVSNDKMFNTLLVMVGSIVIVIIMTGSVFLIYNAFHISLNERTHQFGILLSVGATKKQLRHTVLFEGLCIGAVGIPAGVLLGLCGIDVVITVVARNFGNIMYDSVPLTMKVSVPAIAAAALIALITILISAYLPARKAAATPVLECIRQTNEVKADGKNVKISGFARRLYGLEGILALKNFKRNKKRYRSIVLSLVLSVVLFISVNAFVIYLKQASEMAVVFTTYDIGLAAHKMQDDEMLALYDQLKTAEGIYESSYQEVVQYSAAFRAEDCSRPLQETLDLSAPGETAELSASVQFLDDETYKKKIEEAGLPVEEYTGQNGKLIAVAKLEDHSQRLKEADEFVDMFSRESLEAAIVPKEGDGGKNSRKVMLTFVDIVPEDTLPKLEAGETLPYYFIVMAPWSMKESLIDGNVRTDSKGLTFCSETPSVSVAEMEKMILGAGITTEYNLYNTKEMFEQNTNMIFIANVFAYTFIVLISLIAAANVFNTISTNIKLRKRELAMLRSMGMSEHDFQKMMNFECIFYGMRALYVGIPISLAACVLIYQVMSAGGAENIDFVLPWASIAISVFSVLFIVFITMLYSISKIKKENIIDALRDDLA